MDGQERDVRLSDLPWHDGSLILCHNEQRDHYQGVETYLTANAWFQFQDPAARQQAIETEELWTLQWYPTTAIGFYAIGAPTLQALLVLARSLEAGKECPQ